jgi:hypothetical protein
MRALLIVALCAPCSGCVADRILCAKGVDKVQNVWVGETSGTPDMPVYLWPGDTVFLGAGAGRDPSEEFCPENENMYQSENSPDKFTWSLTDSSVATMLPIGAVVATQEGTTSISVKVGARTSVNSREVQVVPALSSLRLSTDPAQPKAGDIVTVTVEGIGLDGEVVSNPAVTPMTSSRVAPSEWSKGSISTLQNSFQAKTGDYTISVAARRSGNHSMISTVNITVK